MTKETTDNGEIILGDDDPLAKFYPDYRSNMVRLGEAIDEIADVATEAAVDATTKANAAQANAATYTNVQLAVQLGITPLKIPVIAVVSTDTNLANPATSTFDGIVFDETDDEDNRRLLFVSQTAPAQNGLYVFNGPGSALTRASDADTSDKMRPGLLVIATDGTEKGKLWTLLTPDPIVLDTTALTFDRASGDTAGFATQVALDALGEDLADEIAARENLDATSVKTVNNLEPDVDGNVRVEGVSTVAYAERVPVPTITKAAGNPIISQSAFGLSTIYFACLVRMPDSIYNAAPQYGRWRLWTSTDHDSGDGGIAMAHSTPNVDVLDPGAVGVTWTPYAPGGTLAVFKDSSHGTQTETPTVLWNPDQERFQMYYQVYSGLTQTQATWVALSSDGITWTPTDYSIPNPSSEVLGYNHTGYARVFFRNGLWYAWHLGQDGDFGGNTFSYSRDGLNWITDRRRILHALQWTDGFLRIGLGNFFEWRGSPWAFGSLTEFVSGAAVSQHTFRFVAPLQEDWRRLAGRPIYYYLPPQAHEPGGNYGGPWNLASEPRTGKLYGAYRSGLASGSSSYLNIVEVSP